MPYLVLALGAVLSICGALSIYFGYGIIEVERGWTGVIAGATALTGGVIVMTLGLVIKSLDDLRGALKQTAAHAGTAGDSVALPPEPALPGAGSSADADEKPSPATAPDFQDNLLATILAAEDHPETPEPAPQSPSLPPKIDDLLESQRRQADESAAGLGGQPPLFEQETPEAPVVKPRQRVTLKPQATPRKIEPAPVPAGEPAIDDWLDRAFSALDNEVASNPLPDLTSHERNRPQAEPHQEPAPLPPPEPLPVELPPHPSEPMPDQAAHDHGAHDEVKPDHPAPGGEPEPPAQSAAPAEIGRYEADGTSYIMYADGSIDARSEAGSFRFNSMAELKAYIEGIM
jgi:hypothetical protein